MFEDCLFQPKTSAAGGGLVGMNNFAGRLGFRGCIVFQNLKAGADFPAVGWTAPQSGKSKNTVQGCMFTNGLASGTSTRADTVI